MTKFALHTETSAPKNSRPVLEEIKKNIGFIPDLFAVMAESPVMAESYKTLNEIFAKTNLSETERQVILMTINRLNGCTYCMAAHTSLAQMGQVPTDVIVALRSGSEIIDPKLEALRRYTVRVHNTRGWVEQKDLDALFIAGYTKATALEVIVASSLKVLSNYTNHITSTPLDSVFQANSWSDNKRPAA